MKVLVISEGRHELGNTSDDERSSLVAFVRRVVEGELQCDTRKVSDPAFRASHGKGERYFKRAIRCMQRAREWGYDAVVLVVDQDDEPERHRHFAQAQDYLVEPLPRAMGIAVRTYDAWMLADEQALSAALGETIQRLPDPEEIQDPKERCRDLRRQCGLHPGLAEMYETIARTAKIDTIQTRCPQGFGVFVSRLERLNSL